MRPTWMIRGGLLVWIAGVVGAAHAGSIGPIAPSAVTLSIYRDINTTTDIADEYLPEWAPGALQSVYIVVNGSGTAPTLVDTNPAITAADPNPFLRLRTTSHYPGNCTNVGTDTGPDFTLSSVGVPLAGGRTGYLLTSNDCGGMAVIQVGNDTFIVPRDANNNGIPDSWEATFCPGNSCPLGTEDLDSSPNNPGLGDGFAALDEYRGFIVSSTHIRTDPRQKNFFVHVVNPQCGTDSLVGGGTQTFVSGDALFANVNTLGARLHVLNYQSGQNNTTTPTEWVDRFVSYANPGGFLYKVNPTDANTTLIPPADDRQVNRNAVYPRRNTAGNPLPQKGIRIVECVVLDTSTTMGFAPTGSSPNGPAANAVVFTRRILNYFDTTLGATAVGLTYSTFQNAVPTTPVAISHGDLIAKAIQFYLAMEVAHLMKLTPTQEGTDAVRSLYGYHHAPGTGSNLDQTITTSAGIFFIPLLYNTSDQTNFLLK